MCTSPRDACIQLGPDLSTGTKLVFIASLLIMFVGCEREGFTEISISEGGLGWEVTIRADGSGHYQFVGGGAEFASFPQGTFNFTEIVGILQPSLLQKRDEAHPYHVSISERERIKAQGGWSGDEHTIRQIFETARRAGTALSTDRLKKRWESRPPAGATW